MDVEITVSPPLQPTITINQTPCPYEVSEYLLSRGWYMARTSSQPYDGTWSKTEGMYMDYEWYEALAFENFMHLFLMKPATSTPSPSDDTCAGASGMGAV